MKNISTTNLPPGQFLFEYENEIGRGGLGLVRRVRITRSNAHGMSPGSEWACKELHATWNQHPTMRERFEREIVALRSMAHQNIVSCEGENLPGGGRFYLMPLYDTNVREWIAAATSRGDWKHVANLGVTLAEALYYAHSLGFIHRDLKPDNILFNANGPLVIADWGLGYFVHKHSKVLQQLTRGGMGTEYYCSLEQWNTGKCDQRGDIYSLGMTLDEMVTCSQRTIQIGMGVNGPSVSPNSAGASAFNSLIKDMTHAVPSGRPSDMMQVIIALRRAITLG